MSLHSYVRLSYVLISAVHCLAHVVDIPPNCIVNVEEVTEVIVFDHRKLKDVTYVKYGQHLKLICDLNLRSPYTVKWQIPSKVLQEPRVGGKELDIPAMEYALHGQYITCEVALQSNTNAPKDVVGTHLVIEDLARPKINMTENVAVLENEKLTITCKVVAGVPKPAIIWRFKGFEDKVFRDLSATGEELTFNKTGFDNAGQYICTAVNLRGNVTKVAEVNVQKTPTAIIEEGSNKTIAYRTSSTLTCRVSGYPLPRVFWTDKEGRKPYSKVSTVNFHEKVSILKLRGSQTSQTYSCHAENTLGKVQESIDVSVVSPFVVHSHPDNITKVHFGKAITINCNITSSLPISINWYKNTSEIRSNKTYNISGGNTTLSITNMDMGAVGNYTCVASLKTDETEKVAYTTDVQIDDLAPPQISNSNKIVGMEKIELTLYCKLNGGVPPPKRSWLAKRHGDASYSELETTSEELNLPNITIEHAGLYVCVGKNGVGETNMTTDVEIRKAPVTTIAEGSSASVMFLSDVTISCTIVGFPLPSVRWTDADGHFITENNKTSVLHELSTVNQHKVVSTITVSGVRRDSHFHCEGINELGSHSSTFHVSVRPAFVVHQTPEHKTYAHYTAQAVIVCNITSELPMRIKWFHNSSELHTTDKFTISSNRTVLRINSMVLDLEGSYKCEASLVSDENEIVAFSTDVQIDDLEPPKITSYSGSGSTLTFKNYGEMSATCKATGYPTPVISWTAYYDLNPTKINIIGESETVSSSSFHTKFDGIYVCTASNIVGKDSRSIRIISV